MGGFGSGRKAQRDCTGDYLALDVGALAGAGVLNGPARGLAWEWKRNAEVIAWVRMVGGADSIVLDYKTRRSGGEWEPMRYPVRIEWTACNYGGRRPWFLCPAAGCGRRVAKLYAGRLFACRQCYRLAYPCQREPADERAVRRADAIRERLRWVPGFLNGSGGKPKGMHWRTFYRLRTEHDMHADACVLGAAARLGFSVRDVLGD